METDALSVVSKTASTNENLRVVFLTQNDVFYLPEAFRYLLDKFPAHSKIVGAVVFSVSPFGKRESFVDKMLRTFRIFGAGFFFRYGWRYLIGKLFRQDVRDVLMEKQVPILEIEGSINGDEALAKIRNLQPDVLVSIAGNQIFKKQLLEIPTKGTLNLHTALLPKYRGLMPTFWVLKNGEPITGVSVFFVDEGIDSGPILVQKQVAIGNMTQAQLIAETKRLGMDAIVEALDLIESDKYHLIPNPESEKTYFSFPTEQDVREFYALGKRFY